MKESDYTPEELATLQTIPGWEVGQPVPDNLAEVLASISHEAAGEARDPDKIPLPQPGDTPPLKVPEPVDISQLPADRQRAIQEGLARAHQAREEEARGPAGVEGAGPGINEAIAGHAVKDMLVEDDLASPTYSGTEVPKTTPFVDAGVAPPPDLPEGSRTGAQTQLVTECPHCGWDLKEPDPVEPTKDDKDRYLMATAGGIPFQRPYILFGGRMTVVIRELLPSECDQIYKEVWNQRKQGLIQTPQEFFESLTRYRVCLQLVTTNTLEINNKFPENLEAWKGSIVSPAVTTLPQVLEKVYESALRTESLVRVITKLVAHFNRLTAKMEENWYRSDFWEPIGLDGSSQKPPSGE